MAGKDEDSLDWTRETSKSVDTRLAGAKQVQDRIRFVLGVMAVISMMIFIASYNAYMSFDYAWAVEAAQDPGRVFRSEKTAPDVLAEQALRSWADSRNVTISLVGIRVNVDDAPVLGTLSLLVAGIWLLLLVRRENRTISFLLRDTDSTFRSAENADTLKQHAEERWRIFHSIISNSIFMNLDRSLTRIKSLRQPIPSRFGGPVSRLQEKASRGFGGFFFLLPPLACLVMFVFDRWSYFRPSPFRPEAAVPGLGSFFWPSSLVFFVCWILLLICCVNAWLYMTATEAVLREYRDVVVNDARSAAGTNRAG